MPKGSVQVLKHKMNFTSFTCLCGRFCYSYSFGGNKLPIIIRSQHRNLTYEISGYGICISSHSVQHDHQKKPPHPSTRLIIKHFLQVLQTSIQTGQYGAERGSKHLVTCSIIYVNEACRDNLSTDSQYYTVFCNIIKIKLTRTILLVVIM